MHLVEYKIHRLEICVIIVFLVEYSVYQYLILQITSAANIMGIFLALLQTKYKISKLNLAKQQSSLNITRIIIISLFQMLVWFL